MLDEKKVIGIWDKRKHARSRTRAFRAGESTSHRSQIRRDAGGAFVQQERTAYLPALAACRGPRFGMGRVNQVINVHLVKSVLLFALSAVTRAAHASDLVSVERV